MKKENVRVTVRFDLPCAADGYSRRELYAMQDAILARAGTDLRIIWRITNRMNALSAAASAEDVRRLQDQPDVISVTAETEHGLD